MVVLQVNRLDSERFAEASCAEEMNKCCNYPWTGSGWKETVVHDVENSYIHIEVTYIAVFAVPVSFAFLSLVLGSFVAPIVSGTEDIP